MNYGNVGVCRSAGYSTPVLHPFSRKPATTGTLPSSPFCVGMAGFIAHWGSYRALHPHKPRPAWSSLCLSHTGAVLGLCIPINQVQPGAGSWFYQYRQSQPPAVSCCSEARLLPREGTSPFPSIFPLSTTAGSGNELKQPKRASFVRQLQRVS